MNKDYVAAKEALRKLCFADERRAAVYIYGATGYGKTRLVKEYLNKKKTIWLNAYDLEWDLSEIDKNSARGKISYVVVDDMQLLKSELQKKLILELANRSDVWLIMIGRMQIPLWLVPLITDGHLIIVSEEDLSISKDEIKQIADNEQVVLDEQVVNIIDESCYGNAYAVIAIIQLMKSGEAFDVDLQKKIENVFVNHIETNIIPQWDTNLQEFLMQVSVVDEFSLQLAVMITGDNHASSMLELAKGAGNFLVQENDVYRLRPQLIEALRSRALKIFGVNKYNQYVNNAGLYYEMQDDYEIAIRLYEMAGNKVGIRNILIRSARRHPGAVNMYALKQYYLSLEENEIETSIVLMSVMSLLYSIMMNPEKSEYWYGKLSAYASSAKGGEKREANEQLLYLDIALPHRGSFDIADIMKRVASLVASGGISLPEVSLTNNQPSTMNGGKDFCSWSKKDQFLANTIGKLIEKNLGAFGRGLIHAALCESFYEKGKRDDEVLQHAILQQMEVDSGGKIELLFASIGIQVRLNIVMGNASNALYILESFEERARREKAENLYPNIEALKCRVALFLGDENTVKNWMEDAPNEQMEFWTLDRYRYLTKVRCYLSKGQNLEAISLLERLLYYADVSKRTYIRMESKLFLAMALRQEKREWKQTLLEALNEIQEYSFVRIISEKGAGILPLLREIRKEYFEQKNADKNWFEMVKKETTSVSERYPGYLVCDAAQPKDFGDVALSILKMQSEGMSIKAIAEKLGSSERTIKYHAAENYRKLGAKGKTDAVQIARSLNLL